MSNQVGVVTNTEDARARAGTAFKTDAGQGDAAVVSDTIEVDVSSLELTLNEEGGGDDLELGNFNPKALRDIANFESIAVAVRMQTAAGAPSAVGTTVAVYVVFYTVVNGVQIPTAVDKLTATAIEPQEGGYRFAGTEYTPTAGLPLYDVRLGAPSDGGKATVHTWAF